MLKHRLRAQDAIAFKSLAHACMGWNEDAWAEPFLEFERSGNYPAGLKVLEIGAGEWSSMAPYFLSQGKHVTCTYYEQNQLQVIKKRNTKLIEQFRIKQSGTHGSLAYQQMNAFELQGRYDFIFFKSVLGGIFRNSNSQVSDVQNYLNRVAVENLLPDGMLVTMDNGVSLIEPVAGLFGSRRNDWRLFTPADFNRASAQHLFGALGAVSFKSRLGRPGALIEKTLYSLDKMLKVAGVGSAIILSAYSAPVPAPTRLKNTSCVPEISG